jgi:hypothetical protein
MNWHLIFTGHAQDAPDGENIRQQGIGSLTILQNDGTEVASFDAISGPGINGLLPNGNYKADKLTPDSDFADEQGLGYKICIEPVGPLAANFRRSGLRIHPVQHFWSGTVNGERQFQTSPTDGCIGLVGHENAEPFLELMKSYFQQHNSIDLEVDIVDNANVKVQLGNRSNYV